LLLFGFTLVPTWNRDWTWYLDLLIILMVAENMLKSIWWIFLICHLTPKLCGI
jgi:hypothetical protein